MNKFDKLQIAMILQDLESLHTGNHANNIASTAGNLMIDVKKDGFDDKDLVELMLNQSFDSNPNGIVMKIQNTIGSQYDQIKEELKEREDYKGLIALDSILSDNPDFIGLEESLYKLLKSFSKHSKGGEIKDEDDVVIVNISEKSYRLVVAKSDEEKEKGLQDIEELDDNEGMLFDYRDDIQEEISFWMKDTYIPLDIIFVNSENKVISVQKGTPESEELLTEYNVAYVIEVNQNSGIQPGDIVKFGSEDSEVEKEGSSEQPEGVLEVIGSDGEVQATLQGSERIFSIKNTKTLVTMAKRAYESQSDSDYKALGRKVFEYMKIQDNRDPEYVENQ